MITITKDLLLYWWQWYFDNSISLESRYDSKEIKEFEKLINKYGTNKVLDLATISCILSDGSPRIIQLAMNTNSVEELFDAIPNIYLLPLGVIKKWRTIQKEFIETLQIKQKVDNEHR